MMVNYRLVALLGALSSTPRSLAFLASSTPPKATTFRLFSQAKSLAEKVLQNPKWPPGNNYPTNESI